MINHTVVWRRHIWGVVGLWNIKLLQSTAECTLKKLVNRSTFDQLLGKEVDCLIALCMCALTQCPAKNWRTRPRYGVCQTTTDVASENYDGTLNLTVGTIKYLYRQLIPYHEWWLSVIREQNHFAATSLFLIASDAYIQLFHVFWCGYMNIFIRLEARHQPTIGNTLQPVWRYSRVWV